MTDLEMRMIQMLLAGFGGGVALAVAVCQREMLTILRGLYAVMKEAEKARETQ